MSTSLLKKVVKRVLQIGVPIIIGIFFFLYIKDQWNTIVAYKFQWDARLLGLLLLSFCGFLLQELSYGLIWRGVLERLGYQLSLRVCLRIYLASEFVRYTPGNVWHVLTRILWVGRHGVPRPIAFVSMTIELITKLAAGALIFAASLLFWEDTKTVHSLLYGTPLVVGLSILSVLLLLIVLHPRVLNGLLNRVLHLLKREPLLVKTRYSDILLVTLYWCASWIIAGCAFYILLLALWPSAPLAALPLCIGIYAIAWDIGFLSFITPSGLGFREGAIAALFALAFPLPVGLAAIIAVLSRFIFTIAELICVSLAYTGGGRQVHILQQEQGTRVSIADDGTKEEEAYTSTTTKPGRSEEVVEHE